MQHTLLVKVRHTLRYLVYHFQCVDSCGISVAQALQVFDKVSLWIILTDLFKRSRRQPNNKFSGRETSLTRNHGGSPLALDAPKSSSTFGW